MRMLKVNNWTRFQHYKDRNPPWIKLATDTFQNYDFGRLQDASKLLALCSWTLAARNPDGEIPHDLDWIKAQCGLGSGVTLDNLNELIRKGYLVDASNLLASCKQSARPETETEAEREEEREEEESCSYPNIQNQESLGRRAEKNFCADDGVKKNSRGSRLKKFLEQNGEEKICAEMGSFALGLGMPSADIDAEMKIFEDYWNAQPGQKGVKVDWHATWRNWIRRALKTKQAEEARRNAFQRNTR